MITSLPEPPVVDGRGAGRGYRVGRAGCRLTVSSGATAGGGRSASAARRTRSECGSTLVEADRSRVRPLAGPTGRHRRTAGPDPSAPRGAEPPTPPVPTGPLRRAEAGGRWLAGALRIAGSGRLVVIDRWTEVTRPLAPGEAPPLALDQLAAVRRPLEPAPVGLFPGMSMVTWRLG